MAGEARAGAPLRRADLIVAAALLAFGQAEVAYWGVEGDALAAHALWALVAVAALWRRPHPVLFAIVAIAAVGVRYRYGLTPTGGAVYAITTPLALFGIGAYGRDPLRSALLAGVAVAGVEAISVAVTAAGHGPLVGVPRGEWLGQLSIYLAAAGGGLALRDRSEALRAARRRAEELPAEETAVGDALGEERARIARELQAVVAACVRDVMSVSARARRAIADAPAQARGLLTQIGATSRDAMAEMRRMLSLLRTGDAGPEEPAPPSPPERVRSLARALDESGASPRHSATRWRELIRRQGLPVLILVVGVIEAFLASGYSSEIYGTASLGVKVLGSVALALAFVPRRRYPLFTAIAVAVLLPLRVAVLDDFFTLNLALYLGAFVAGAYCRTAVAASLGGMIVLVGGISVPPLVGYELPAGAYISTVVVTAAAWLTGVAGRRRLAQAEQMHELAEAEEERSRLAVERALATERLEIARELHDVIGHGLTSITLGAAAAERLIDERPDDARAAIDSIQGAGSEVETELAMLLKALAGRAEAPPPRLVDVLARLGGEHHVNLRASGPLEAVPIGQGGAAGRVIQEAVHNARKHGAPGEITVSVVAADECLEVEVTSRLAVAPAREGGLGLIGMRERVALYDGDFTAGADDPGTWAVRASLPLAPAPARSAAPAGA